MYTIGGKTTTTDYFGSEVYENGTLVRVLTEDGYVSAGDGKFHYFLQDHQGNNRVVLSQDGTVEEVNHYYPFGGLFATANSVQPYKYNGKELDTKAGLDWYDYGARQYDAAIGRWHTMDPMAEENYHLTPYDYCGSNPVNNVDPDGMLWDWYQNDYGNVMWQRGSDPIPGYQNIGATFSVPILDGWFINYYQNVIISFSRFGAHNAFENILNDVRLQRELLRSGSDWLSEADKLKLFNALNSRTLDNIYRPLGEELVMWGAGGLAGGIIGKAIGKVGGWALGKAGKSSVGIGYDSFRAFKKVYGAAGEGMAWHHIVEQNPSNLAKFGAKAIHNTNNLIKLPHGKGSIHAKVTGYYNSKPDYLNGLTVRQWLSTKSFQEQYEFGINILKNFGWKP